jgi:hypothetical protein
MTCGTRPPRTPKAPTGLRFRNGSVLQDQDENRGLLPPRRALGFARRLSAEAVFSGRIKSSRTSFVSFPRRIPLRRHPDDLLKAAGPRLERLPLLPIVGVPVVDGRDAGLDVVQDSRDRKAGEPIEAMQEAAVLLRSSPRSSTRARRRTRWIAFWRPVQWPEVRELGKTHGRCVRPHTEDDMEGGPGQGHAMRKSVLGALRRNRPPSRR